MATPVWRGAAVVEEPASSDRRLGACRRDRRARITRRSARPAGLSPPSPSPRPSLRRRCTRSPFRRSRPGPLAWVALVPFLVVLRDAGWRRRLGLGLLWTLVSRLERRHVDAVRGAAFYFDQPLAIGDRDLPDRDRSDGGALLRGRSPCAYAPLTRFGAATPLLVGAAWAAAELARGRLLNGTLIYVGNSPWATLGYSQAGFIPLVQIASLDRRLRRVVPARRGERRARGARRARSPSRAASGAGAGAGLALGSAHRDRASPSGRSRCVRPRGARRPPTSRRDRAGQPRCGRALEPGGTGTHARDLSTPHARRLRARQARDRLLARSRADLVRRAGRSSMRRALAATLAATMPSS